MLLKVDSYYSRYLNGLSEVELEGSTIGECLVSSFNIFPQLLVHLMDNDAEVSLQSSFQFNGEHIWEAKEVRREVEVTDVLVLAYSVPSGAGGGFGLHQLDPLYHLGIVPKEISQIGMGIGFIVVGAVLAPFTAGLSSSLIKIGIGSIVAGLAGIIMKEFFTPDVPDNSTSFLNNSSTYTFDGIKNTTPSGQPIQVVYGKHRVGGHVLSMYTVNESTTRVTIDGSSILSYDYLMAQIGLCEGEIESVSDLFVNNYPVHYYDEVTSFEGNLDLVRLGTETQTPMKDFNSIRNTTSINLKVQSTASPITAAVDTSVTTYSPMYGYVLENSVDPTTGDYKLTYSPDYSN